MLKRCSQYKPLYIIKSSIFKEFHRLFDIYIYIYREIIPAKKDINIALLKKILRFQINFFKDSKTIFREIVEKLQVF